jgi:hypothetical protein
MATINAAVDGIILTADSSATLSLATSGVVRTTIDSSGNFNFAGTAQRITGDFSNATAANRLAFQSSTTNGNTNIEVLPNGTGTVSGLILESGSDFNSCSNTQLLVINGSDSRITAGIRGTGSYLPMTFYTNGAEKVRLTTTGNLLVGTTTDVPGLSGVISDVAGNVRNIPSAGAAKTSEYTLTVTDIGEFVTVSTSGKVLVPNNTFSTGNAISVYNDTTGNVSINISTTTAYVVGTNTNRTGVTLATRGIANILFINPSYCILSGNLT